MCTYLLLSLFPSYPFHLCFPIFSLALLFRSSVPILYPQVSTPHTHLIIFGPYFLTSVPFLFPCSQYSDFSSSLWQQQTCLQVSAGPHHTQHKYTHLYMEVVAVMEALEEMGVWVHLWISLDCRPYFPVGATRATKHSFGWMFWLLISFLPFWMTVPWMLIIWWPLVQTQLFHLLQPHWALDYVQTRPSPEPWLWPQTDPDSGQTWLHTPL